MGKIEKHIKSELKELPFMLGKLMGAVLAVIGFPGMIIVTRKSTALFSDTLPYLFLGIMGICVFIISSRLHLKRRNETINSTPTPKEKIQTSILSWIILLVIAAIFIVITLIVTS